MAENLAIDFTQNAECSKCGTEKDIWTDYYWRRNGRRSNACKECVRTSQKERTCNRYNNDPEFRDRYRKYQSDYRKARSGDPFFQLKMKEREARHKVNSPLSSKEKGKRWRQRHPEFQLWRGARERANKKGIEFTLTREWVLKRLATGVCEATGIRFNSETFIGRCGPYSPSIDRIDSSKGYTPDNCRMICWALNMGLSEWGEEVYLDIAKAFIEKSSG
jgi:hypothetical protein